MMYDGLLFLLEYTDIGLAIGLFLLLIAFSVLFFKE